MDVGEAPAGGRGGSAVIEVRDLRMRYGAVDVLDGIGFSARRGEVLALLGPNGAGKTTTIEILEGFRMRSAGEVARARASIPARGGRAVAGPARRRAPVLARPRPVAGARTPRTTSARYYAPYSTPGSRRPSAWTS